MTVVLCESTRPASATVALMTGERVAEVDESTRDVAISLVVHVMTAVALSVGTAEIDESDGGVVSATVGARTTSTQ